MFFILNYVEFTQGKLRIARDTTVNDYLCCKGVKWTKFGPIFHTQFADKIDACDLSDYA